MHLLAQHRRHGRRLEPLEFVEQGERVAVLLGVTDPRWSGRAEVFKVFTFAPPRDDVVLLQDCVDREDALAQLASA